MIVYYKYESRADIPRVATARIARSFDRIVTEISLWWFHMYASTFPSPILLFFSSSFLVTRWKCTRNSNRAQIASNPRQHGSRLSCQIEMRRRKIHVMRVRLIARAYDTCLSMHFPLFWFHVCLQLVPQACNRAFHNVTVAGNDILRIQSALIWKIDDS